MHKFSIDICCRGKKFPKAFFPLSISCSTSCLSPHRTQVIQGWRQTESERSERLGYFFLSYCFFLLPHPFFVSQKFKILLSISVAGVTVSLPLSVQMILFTWWLDQMALFQTHALNSSTSDESVLQFDSIFHFSTMKV